jgi:hypothetical protein
MSHCYHHCNQYHIRSRFHKLVRKTDLLNFAYLTQFDALHFHAFSCKWHDFIFLYGWVTFHNIYHVFFNHSPAIGNPVWFNNLMAGGGGNDKVENMGFSGSASGERVAQDHWFKVNECGLKAQKAVPMKNTGSGSSDLSHWAAPRAHRPQCHLSQWL